uniref:MARVEL domain-containing protein n=1 Tax=Parastrongyloides trichosuri TaxID=131310 RepID=A0A0N4ZQL2_PARTI
MILSIICVLVNILAYDYRCQNIFLSNIPNILFTFWSIISFVSHFFDLQKNLTTKPNKYFYIPFALIDFSFGLFGPILYGIICIFSVDCFFRKYYYNVFTSFQFILQFTSSLGVSCLYALYCLLIFVQTQNIKDLPIKEMIIEGEKITYMTPTKCEEKEPLSVAIDIMENCD